jgi:hypothetical protein
VTKVTSLKNGTAPPELDTPSDLKPNAVSEIRRVNVILADEFFALYLKTKNFIGTSAARTFRDYHLLFEEQAAQSLKPRTRSPSGSARSAHDATPIGHNSEVSRSPTMTQEFVPAGDSGSCTDERQQDGRGRDAQGCMILRLARDVGQRRSLLKFTSTPPRSGPEFLFRGGPAARTSREH